MISPYLKVHLATGKGFTSGIPPLVEEMFLQISRHGQAGVKIAGINAEAFGVEKIDHKFSWICFNEGDV